MTVDLENDLLLITAASGKQATSTLLPLVSKKWKRLRLNVSSVASKEKLEKQYPNAEVTQCDVSDAKACKKLLEGVTACWMVTPPFHTHETECGCNLINAALANVNFGGPFKHMVHSSVIFPILRKLVNHDNKRYVEEYLVESGLPYTIVQPTHMMETVNIAAIMEQENPVMPRMWDPSTKFTFVSARDVGEAAANILEKREHHLYATYQLVGTREPLSYNEAFDIISTEIGRKVRLERKSVEEGAEMFASMFTHGKPEEASPVMKQGVAMMFLHYNFHGLVGNPNVLEMLLGRKPLDYQEWVKLNVKDLRG